MARCLSKNKGSVAIFIGDHKIENHSQKVQGFMQEAQIEPFRITGVYETQDDPEIAVSIVEKLIREVPDLESIYVATGNSISLCQYLESQHLSIKVIATDVFPELVRYMEQGVVTCTIFQDPITQGRESIKLLSGFLTEGLMPAENNLLPPQVIFKNNAQLFL
jgi:LacI family transcriptional regulator